MRRRRSGLSRTSRSRCPRVRCSASSAATAQGSRRSSRSSRGSRRRPRAVPRSAAGSAACSRSGRASTRSSPGRENIYLNGAILGMKRREIEQRFDEIVEFSGVEKFIDTPVKRYSSGMYVRLAFAVAAHLEPEILFVDEVLAVGDAEFQTRASDGWRTSATPVARCSSSPTTCRPSPSSAITRSCWTGDASCVEGRVRRSSRTTCRRRPGRARAGRGRWKRRRGTSLSASDRSGSSTRTRRRWTTSTSDAPSGSSSGSPCSKAAALRRPEAQGHDRRAGRVQRDGHRPSLAPASPPGDYVATAWIPGNLLNEGLVSVDAAVCSIDSPKLHHHVSVHEAVSFHVQDPAEGDSSRGTFTGQWRGIVRPLLEWTVR